MTKKQKALTSERRLRFASAETNRSPGSRAEVRVNLALRSRDPDSDEPEHVFTGEAAGVGADLLEPRLAVEATLGAIAEATGRPEHFRLVGIKVIPAFDSRVVLVCVRTRDEPAIQVVGSVPSSGDIVRTAVKATLDATNRLLGKLLG